MWWHAGFAHPDLVAVAVRLMLEPVEVLVAMPDPGLVAVANPIPEPLVWGHAGFAHPDLVAVAVHLVLQPVKGFVALSDPGLVAVVANLIPEPLVWGSALPLPSCRHLLAPLDS